MMAQPVPFSSSDLATGVNFAIPQRETDLQLSSTTENFTAIATHQVVSFFIARFDLLDAATSIDLPFSPLILFET